MMELGKLGMRGELTASVIRGPKASPWQRFKDFLRSIWL